MRPNRHTLIATLALATWSVSCGGEASTQPRVQMQPDAGLDGGAEVEDAEVEPTELAVLADTPLTTRSTCVTLEEGEELGAVSPEGHAWFVTRGDAGTMLRVWDPELKGDGPTLEGTIDLPDITRMIARSGQRMDAIAGGDLWRIDALRRTRVSAPMTLGPDATFCGELGGDGYVLSGGTVYTQRDGEWWSWEPAAQTTASAPSALLSRDGECYGADGAAWATAEDGTVWKLTAPVASGTKSFDSLGEAAVAGGDLAVRVDDALWVGEPGSFTGWRFDGGAPARVSASADHVWFTLGGDLMRHDGARFVRVEHGLEAGIDAIHPFHNGAWIVGGGQACQHVDGLTLRFGGVRPNQRLSNPNLGFDASVLGEDGLVTGGASVTIELDGAPLTTTDGRGFYVASTTLDAGWHTLAMSATLGERQATRTLDVAYLPPASEAASWEADVKPIFEQSCNGSSCHGTDALSLDLTTYPAWLTHSENIRNRVVVTESMPPPATRDGWSDDSMDTIERWFDTGMAP